MRTPLVCLLPVVCLTLLLALCLSGKAVGDALPPSAPDHEFRVDAIHITMPDGTRLAADLFRPTGGESGERFPVLLEYYPYRKNTYQGRNYPLHSYFARRGYIVAVVDVRGTGNSEGTLPPQAYSEQELADGEAVIAWLAAQPWSNGRVAMFGVSYSGFNAIQMAMRQPPALRTIIAVDATEYLYAEDVYFIDGIMHLDSYEMLMDVDNARPGAPDYVMDEAYFRDRFDQPPYTLLNKRHQRDGAYWDRVSLKGRYDQLRIPSFHIGGWFDGYRNSPPRMLANLDAPVKAIIGPWSHGYPHDAYPKPQIEWRREAVRWFDYWLKDRDTGILDEPRFAVYVRHWHQPGPYRPSIPGAWRWEDSWPIERLEFHRWWLQENHGLARQAGTPSIHRLRNIATSGMEAGGPVMWWGDVAHDQRPSDAYSLVYDSAPLDSELEILGHPQAQLRVAADVSRANWFVRLSDVAPDGTVTLITGAGANGTHRRSARQPEDLVAGEFFDLEVKLHFTSWVFPAGHRLRVSISNAQWPMFWPSAYPLTSAIQLGGSQGSSLQLPVIPFAPRPVPQFEQPAPDPEAPGFAALDLGTPSGYGEISEVIRRPAAAETAIRVTNRSGQTLPWGTEIYDEFFEHLSSDDHPENTSVRGRHSFLVELPGRRLFWEGDTELRSDRENFYYSYTRRVSENGKLLREKTWKETIPRDFQ